METRLRFFNRENLFAFAFLVILLSLFWLVVTILDPFLGDFLWAIILAFTFYPLYKRLHSRLRGKGNLAASMLTVLVFLCLGLPGFFVLMNLGQEAKKAYQALSSASWIEKGRSLTDRFPAAKIQGIMEMLGVEPEQAEAILQEGIGSGLKSIPMIVGEKVSSVFKNLALFVIHALFVAVALFFFFRDGARYAVLLAELLPLELRHRELVVNTFSRTVSAVVRGMFLTALVQGFLAGMGFAVAGVPVPVLLGLLTFITSMIPFLGATSVWLPAAIWLFIQEQTLAAVGLALWGACVVSVVDNIIKPVVIGEETKIPVFLLFFTILGGLRVYGVLGVFLGPIILAMGMAFLTIYRELYLPTGAGRQGPGKGPKAETPSPKETAG
ncbi:MAG: AI-2E family transporter [Thermodesulfobacteriota bacterium]